MPGGTSHMRHCGATKRDGSSCRQPAMHGQARCRMHGGSIPQSLVAAERRITELAVRSQARQYGTPRYVGPLAALDEELARSAGVVEFLDAKLADQVDPGWLVVYQQERQHYSNLAQKMAALDTEGRKATLTEQQTDELFSAINGILTDLGHNPNTDHVRQVVARNLKAVTDDPRVIDVEVVPDAGTYGSALSDF